MAKLPTYEVGYMKPPTATRFQKGSSGNPKGRPKGSMNLATMFNKALMEKVTITEKGRKREISKLEAALKQLVNRAAQGEIKAMQQLISMGHLIGVEETGRGTRLADTDQQIMASLVARINPPAPQVKKK